MDRRYPAHFAEPQPRWSTMRSPLVLASAGESSLHAQSSRWLSENVILYGAVSLLLFGPLAFGAVEPWSILILESGAAVLMGLWAVWQASQEEVRIIWSPVFLPMLGFAALIAFQ